MKKQVVYVVRYSRPFEENGELYLEKVFSDRHKATDYVLKESKVWYKEGYLYHIDQMVLE